MPEAIAVDQPPTDDFRAAVVAEASIPVPEIPLIATDGIVTAEAEAPALEVVEAEESSVPENEEPSEFEKSIAEWDARQSLSLSVIRSAHKQRAAIEGRRQYCEKNGMTYYPHLSANTPTFK